jgi:hypothetical protein
VIDVHDEQLVSGPAGDPSRPPDLLIEVPHGATRREHFDVVRRELESKLPDDLDAFFFVNTDVGAPECARQVARLVAHAGAGTRQVLVVLGLVPRTFIDCNRMLDGDSADYRQSGFTPALPDYVDAPADVALLQDLYRRYQQAASRAYERVCGAGGSALIVHSYAPRSVDITTVDANIVRALRAAYEPEAFARWPARPDVDLISRDTADVLMAPAELAATVRARFVAAGFGVEENASYRLHPKTMGYRRSADWPGRVLCLELNRGLLADPFDPFAEMRIGAANVERMSAPLAMAWLDWQGG